MARVALRGEEAYAPPPPEWHAGPVNSALVGGKVVDIPDVLQGPALELTDGEIELASQVFGYSLEFLRERFPDSDVGVVYLPSPLSSYRLASDTVSTQTYHGRDEVYPASLVAERSDAIARRIRELTESQGCAFVDAREHLRRESAETLIHGPKDWKHYNRTGLEALTDAVLEDPVCHERARPRRGAQHMSRRVRVRFAPSPTGHLHLGGARTALFNWLFAKSNGGSFVLRVEDTDVARSTADSERAVLSDLAWLGLEWDEGPDVGGPHGPYRQSERLDIYREQADRLLEGGDAFLCYCTDEELEEKRKAALAEGRDPRYDGTCRELGRAEREEREAEGRKPVVRFRTQARDVKVHDLVRGDVEFGREMLGDFVVLRSDGRPTYNFAVVVDDALMEISHVIRAEEHLPNTMRQVLVYEALGFDQAVVRARLPDRRQGQEQAVEAAGCHLGRRVPRAGLSPRGSRELPGASRVVSDGRSGAVHPGGTA